MLMQVQGVSYTYAKKNRPAISNFNLEIDEGEIIAVVGRTGCGKTTLGNLITGVIPGIYTDGKLEGDILKLTGTNIGLVSQSPESQLFGYSVEDAILFGLENMCLPHDEVAERMEHILQMLNITHLRKRPIEKLSGGQKQSVCIASILAMGPKVIVMDEPVGSLDPAGKQIVQSVIRRLHEEKQTIMLLDQNLEWSCDVISRVIGLEDGELVFDGTLDEFISDPDLCTRLGVTLPPTADVCHHLIRSGVKAPVCTHWDGELKNACTGHAFTCPAPAEEPTDNGAILEVKDLRHAFGDFEALRGVSVSFQKGCVTTILGQNGCGKTTMVKHLNGLLRPTTGTVLFKGEDIKDKSVAQMSGCVAFCFQHPDQMLFEDTVEKELTFTSRMRGKEVSREAVLEMLKTYKLEDTIDMFPANLSMGQKHMISILACAATDAEVYIFDEPTLGMDSVLKEHLVSLITSLRDNGKTVILISHELPFVCRVSDRIVMIKQGELLATGSCTEIFSQPELFRTSNIPMPQIRLIADELGLPSHILTAQQLSECVRGAFTNGEEVQN